MNTTTSDVFKKGYSEAVVFVVDHRTTIGDGIVFVENGAFCSNPILQNDSFKSSSRGIQVDRHNRGSISNPNGFESSLDIAEWNKQESAFIEQNSVGGTHASHQQSAWANFHICLTVCCNTGGKGDAILFVKDGLELGEKLLICHLNSITSNEYATFLNVVHILPQLLIRSRMLSSLRLLQNRSIQSGVRAFSITKGRVAWSCVFEINSFRRTSGTTSRLLSQTRWDSTSTRTPSIPFVF